MSELLKSKSSTLKFPQADMKVIFAAIAFFLLTLILTLHRHYTFYSTYDQGSFHQMFWNSLHGRFFNTSLASVLSAEVIYGGEFPTVTHNHLGQHFTPSMLLWLPLYALFPQGITLIILQVALVTAAGLVLYTLARQYLHPPVAAMIGCSFYTATAVIGPTLSDFHNVSQLPLFVFTLLLALEKRWWIVFALLVAAILGVREDSGLVIFGIGVYLILSKRYPRVGIGLCALSFLYVMAVTNLIMPQFSADVSQRFLVDKFGQYVDSDEASAWQVLWGMISQPWLVIWELIAPPGRTLKYLINQELPLAFIPLASPTAWLVAGFPLLLLLLGQGLSVLAITIRYAMTVVPGLFYGAILWWAGQTFANFTQPMNHLKPRRLTPRFQRFWIGCMVLSIVVTITANPNRTFYFIIPDSVQPWVFVSLPEQWRHSAQIYQFLARIPAQASVSTTTEIVPHLSGRSAVIRLPGIDFRDAGGDRQQVEYLIADLWRLQKYQVAFREERQALYYITTLIDVLIQQRTYGILGFQDGVVFLQKNVVNQPEAIAAWLAYRQNLNPLMQAIEKNLNTK